MTTMVAVRDPTILQPPEGIPLDPIAATLEHIRVRLARLEARFDERDRWATAVRPPAQPPLEPDPPYGIPYYTSWNFGVPTTEANNSIGHQPYTTVDAASQPQPYLHHPSHPPSSGPDPYVQQCLPDAGYPLWQPEYQPPRPLLLPDRSPKPTHSTSCWSPSSHRRSAAPLPAVAAAPPPPPQQLKKFIDSGRKHSLTNNPNPLVRSPSSAQLADVSDYNERLRVYRLDQAALLGCVTAWFEKNIDDENIVDENVDDAPTMILSENVPEDINDVPSNAPHNDGATFDAPHNEFVQQIVRNDEDGSLKASSPRHDAVECVQIASVFCENINITAAKAFAIDGPRLRLLGNLSVGEEQKGNIADANGINALVGLFLRWHQSPNGVGRYR